MDGDRYYQEYINFLVQAGSSVEEEFKVPSDYPEHLRAGQEYSDLISRPAWKRLLDDMEARANKALAELRSCTDNNPMVVMRLRDKWVEAEDSLKFVQVTPQEAIARRRAILQEIGETLGVSPDMDFGLGQNPNPNIPNFDEVTADE